MSIGGGRYACVRILGVEVRNKAAYDVAAVKIRLGVLVCSTYKVLSCRGCNYVTVFKGDDTLGSDARRDRLIGGRTEKVSAIGVNSCTGHGCVDVALSGDESGGIHITGRAREHVSAAVDGIRVAQAVIDSLM